jgi:hypothetical protein
MELFRPNYGKGQLSIKHPTGGFRAVTTHLLVHSLATMFHAQSIVLFLHGVLGVLVVPHVKQQHPHMLQPELDNVPNFMKLLTVGSPAQLFHYNNPNFVIQFHVIQ